MAIGRVTRVRDLLDAGFGFATFYIRLINSSCNGIITEIPGSEPESCYQRRNLCERAPAPVAGPS